jgi:hypothetical protein
MKPKAALQQQVYLLGSTVAHKLLMMMKMDSHTSMFELKTLVNT